MDTKEYLKKKEIMDARGSLVVKHNDLLRKTRYNLSAVEQKIVLYCVSQIKLDDKELKEVKIDIKTFCEICNIQVNGESYKRIKDTIQSLSNKSWWIPTNRDSEILFRWINEAEITKGERTVTIQLSKLLTPYLIELKEQFVKYELIHVLMLKSRYAIRLYELLKSYLWLGYWKVSVEELKDILQVKDKYNKFKYFKNKVLNKAIKEINENTDLDVTFECIKNGRNITHIYFSISEKQGYQMLMPILEKQKEKLG